MTVGSLFSGIGGLDLGLERAGMRIVWQCEKDAFCRKVLRKHWPDVPCYQDVKEIDERAPRVDLICGGFPCQPVSLAGKRLGTADPRWLWPEFERVLRDLRPRYALVENTPGLLTLGMGEVIGGLAHLGYDAEWSLLSVCSVSGPHRRRRLFILAYSDGFDGQKGQRMGLWGITINGWSICSSSDWASARTLWKETVERNAGSLDGLPYPVDRIRTIGNSVSPQVAQYVGRRIMEVADA